MDNQKNILILFLLSLVVWLGCQTWLGPSPKKNETRAPLSLVEKTPSLSLQEALHREPRFSIEDSFSHASITLKGLKVDHWLLKKYRQEWQEKSLPMTLLSPSLTPETVYSSFGWFGPQENELPSSDTVWKVVSRNPHVLSWRNQKGVTFIIELRFSHPYVLEVVQKIDNRSSAPLSLGTLSEIFRHGNTQRPLYEEGVIGVLSGQLGYNEADEHPFRKVGYSEEKGSGWLGITDKYWLCALIPSPFTQLKLGEKTLSKPNSENMDGSKFFAKNSSRKVSKISLAGPLVTVMPNTLWKSRTSLFVGPKIPSLLRDYEKSLRAQDFHLSIDYGWFYIITKPMLLVLTWLKEKLGHFGLALIALTILLKVIFFPLSLKSYRSMARVKKFQPQLQALKSQFQHDPKRLNEAMMALYRKEKINPASGCLPMIIQWPVFFALYKVFSISIDARHAPFWGWIHDLSAPDPTSLFNGFGLLPWSLPSFMQVGAWPLLMGLSMVLQQRFQGAAVTLDAQQRIMFTYVMPCLFTVMLANVPVGVIIYWTLNNFLTLVQQLIIQRLDPS